ncbi:hypothetical protein [Jatrophihabitans sp.]|uniref:hypothetical protein n=1 Tax=Jatrophihabitans sp. TaxID=1932789 RepID=UPI002B987A60|nr:hypothetical protein [Jatrophihabitans sp.]
MAEEDFDDESGAEVERTFGGLHDRFVTIVLDEMERERFPSNQMLDLLESHMTVRDRVRIVNLLLDKIAAQRYPSPDMLRRVSRLVG